MQLCFLSSLRSAPPSPTHHPIMHTDLNPRELEAKFAMPTPPTTSHFALPHFFSQISSSSHSLPASPSRLLPPSFSATPLKFFPAKIRSSSTEALALERPRKVWEPIYEAEEERDEPASKRPRLADGEGNQEALDDRPTITHMRATMGGRMKMPEGRPIQIPTITSLPTAAAALQFSQPNTLQFLSIPLMTSSAVTQPGQTILSQPLSSFLPQNFFAAAGGGGAPPTNVTPRRQDSSSSGSDEG